VRSPHPRSDPGLSIATCSSQYDDRRTRWYQSILSIQDSNGPLRARFHLLTAMYFRDPIPYLAAR
jgi:hypothetical protein